MKILISIVAMICGTALLITQFLHDGFVSGGPAYCEYMGIVFCVAGVVMGFMVLSVPAAHGVSEASAAA